KPANLVILMGQGPGFDSPQNSACSVSSQGHGVLIIVTTACWTDKGEGGTGDTQIDQGKPSREDSCLIARKTLERSRLWVAPFSDFCERQQLSAFRDVGLERRLWSASPFAALFLIIFVQAT